MSIKYDIHMIGNAKGEGKEQQYVQPVLQDARTRKELEEEICHSCTLTPGDLEAVFCAISRVMTVELTSGRRFFLPGVGYFSPHLRLHQPQDADEAKARYVTLDYVKFRPEADMLRQLKSKARFERLKGTTRSRVYGKEEMAEKVRVYLQSHRSIGRSVMETEFGLRPTMARKWLNMLVDSGLLVKEGVRNAPVYYLR